MPSASAEMDPFWRGAGFGGIPAAVMNVSSPFAGAEQCENVLRRAARKVVRLGESEIVKRMRRDWDARALENAKYYVNCQRWEQGDDEFNDSAPDILARVRRDYPLLPPVAAKERRFLELGCGIGRLMLSLAGDCGEIHGVDVSPEMIRLGKERLAAVTHARFHLSHGSTLSQFEDASFDLVYSFAVFQHIPDRDLVFGYLDESFRILKPGGLIVAQLNGAPPAEDRLDTWVGVWLPEETLFSYAIDRGWRVLSSEGARTQYLWLTMKKPDIRADRNSIGPDVTVKAILGAQRERERLYHRGWAGWLRGDSRARLAGRFLQLD